jgi:hypothetical protein
MHAVQVKVTIKDPERALSELQERIVPMVKQAPGFVAGYWLAPEGDHAESLVIFESEEAANGMVEAVRGMPGQDEAPVTFESIEARGITANA